MTRLHPPYAQMRMGRGAAERGGGAARERGNRRSGDRALMPANLNRIFQALVIKS